MRKSVFTVPAAAIAAFAFTTPSVINADDEVPRWQTAQPAGEARSCISLRQIRDTDVHDDSTIDFRMAGGQIYRNRLPYRCSGLGFEEAFTYRTSISQLCSSDIITVLRTPLESGPGPSCGLGEFVPIEYPEKG